ncbi:MAG: ArsR/SmtB family transcription factor [Gemmatimonadales bacterium]
MVNQVVKYSPALDRTFAALADPVRRAVLERLQDGEATVSELAEPHRMSLPAFLKHVGVLRRAGLVSDRKVGRERRCRLAARPLEAAEDWITQYRRFWGRQLDSLERYLTDQPDKEDPAWQQPQSTPPTPSRSGGRSRRRSTRSTRRGPRRRR